MANRSYLVTTNSSSIGTEFDSEKQLIAWGRHCVPLSWFGLFRPKDMHKKIILSKNETNVDYVLLVDVKSGCAQLKSSVAVYDRIFPNGNFSQYCDALTLAIVSSGRSHIAVEFGEIAGAGIDEDKFYEVVRNILGAMDMERSIEELTGLKREESTDAICRSNLARVSDLNKDTLIPNAFFKLGAAKPTDEQLKIHSSIIGHGWLISVPWEKNNVQ